MRTLPLSHLVWLVVALAACGINTDESSPFVDMSASSGLPANCIALDAPTNDYVRCSGTFDVGKAATLCPDKYAPIANAPMPAIVVQGCQNDVNLIAANVTFAVDVGLWADPANPFTRVSCTPQAGWLPALMVCGNEDGATAFANCQNWPRAVITGKSAFWSTADGTLAKAKNTNPKNGIVCKRSMPQALVALRGSR